MGFHLCPACGGDERTGRYSKYSSGDVRLEFTGGNCWVMPDMILHYVADHEWQPPEKFVQDVMTGTLKACRRRQTRGPMSVFEGAAMIGYLEGEILSGTVPDGFVERLERLMRQASGAGMRVQTKGATSR